MLRKVLQTLCVVAIALGAMALAHDFHDVLNGEPHCGTPVISERDADQVDQIVARFKSIICNNAEPGTVRICEDVHVRATKFDPITIPVNWHVFYDSATGGGMNVTTEMIDHQTDIMNEDFAGLNPGGPGGYHSTSFRFEVANVNFVDHSNWFHNMIAREKIYKKQLANSTDTHLNMYVGEMRGGVLGMCYFAFMYPADSHMHGCLIHHSSMVGGGQTNYDNGQTCTHEVGHHIGLYHVWQAKCSERSDRVEDTPPQKTNSRGCPSPVPESCTPGLYDNIHNFMDYSDDICRWEFSAGQSQRADEIITVFHPGYLSHAERSAIRVAADRAGLADAWAEAGRFQSRFAAREAEWTQFL
ncbi:hypothetical protein H696_05587 [Fonticula alba]|uniref:Peptidase M43 pregnancy-associated plasma-A domain-containing protein n=1 Tax=Fonticula alba TaxID=691883 RepID=A0A058Z2V9_FONAL|nr:hypothetical protein H696_05587 [Fonticula alba]KCV67857.1 hypothetical protein H696_05587 [Fonticula alba]|eukprot:XP_009497677.1 hypothetical protein H696_05587 [Fonticula alba]